MPELPPGLLDALGGAGRVVALTGSGVSAESGVPTFREAQTGLWERFDPQELATPEAFARDPWLVWSWYEWRRKLVERAEPNPGHLALAELERRLPDFALVTQNVDGLHQRAGSRNVTELHGNILRSKCSLEGAAVDDYAPDVAPPPCPNCGAPLRPDVVWFGEALPSEAFEAASGAARACDLFLSVGTSSLVYPAAALPFEALENGAWLVEVNPNETPLTPHAHHLLRGPAGEVLPGLVEAIS
ncbi:MAG: NAD-dependent deacylase [Actinomycetota bacterium]|nr:NAD-dependent deacylase [Actinomycetota bacterium]